MIAGLLAAIVALGNIAYVNLAPQWEINFGLGVGLTRATGHLIAKTIVGYRLNF